MIAFVAVLCLALLVLVVLRPAEEEPVGAGREHAVVACDLTSKAEEAAGVATDASLAAAVLLLDQAVVASARASETDVAFADLDDAVQAVHTAGHRGDPEQWQEALDTAMTACSESTG